MHADHPGEKPRVLYWYRTAPGAALGRAPLDEEAIRTIEEQHPHVEFDWPAILALSEVMTPEDEEPARPPAGQQRKKRRDRRDDRQDARGGAEPERESDSRQPEDVPKEEQAPPPDEGEDASPARATPVNRLLDELAGREIATRLRARYAEVVARIHESNADSARRDAWLKRAERLNADLWVTPDAILDGVRNADALFDELRSELLKPEA